jgi:hypothetical protein
MRTWFLFYYDRTIATYDKYSNVLKTLGYHPEGSSPRIRLMRWEHSSHRNLLLTALIENQADLRLFQNQNPNAGLAHEMIIPPAWIEVNA